MYLCPRSTARLQRSPVGRVESFRSWTSHLFRPRNRRWDSEVRPVGPLQQFIISDSVVPSGIINILTTRTTLVLLRDFQHRCNHPMWPVGSVSSDFGDLTDQAYFVPSNFCNQLSFYWALWELFGHPQTSHLDLIGGKKVAHTRLPSVGFRSWSRFLAVSLQVTRIINPTVGCHYFPPGLQLPPQPLRGLLLTEVEARKTCKGDRSDHWKPLELGRQTSRRQRSPMSVIGVSYPREERRWSGVPKKVPWRRVQMLTKCLVCENPFRSTRP